MGKGNVYPGMFKRHYPLRGKNWLQSVDGESRKIFSEVGRQELAARDIDWHRLGGKARAEKGIRCPCGCGTFGKCLTYKENESYG